MNSDNPINGGSYICPRTQKACSYLNDPRWHTFADPERFESDPDLCSQLLNDVTCGYWNMAGMIEGIRLIARQKDHEYMYSPESMSDEQRDNS